MKKFLYIIFAYMLFLPFSVSATTYGIVNDVDGLNLRSDATATSNKITSITYNSQVELLETTKYPDKGTACSAGWYRVKYGNYTGYACSSYLNTYEITEGNTNRPFSAKVDCSSYITVWNDRVKWNGRNPIDKLITGTYVTVLEEYPSGNGCDEPWYKIQYHKNKVAYVCSNDISKIDELRVEPSNFTESEKAYALELKADGFVDSYIPYLINLKRKHPNWNFKAHNTNIYWNDLISGQSGKNKIEGATTTSEYLPMYVSSMVGTEGGDWYYTNNSTNAYFLDPRNFLTERFILMFEKVDFKENLHTDQNIYSFIRDIEDKNKTTIWLKNSDIRSYLLNAGKNYLVSPFYLIARILKEGGGNSNYEPVTGTSSRTPNGISLFGHYNFFNIGAYTGLQDGLCFATGYSSCNPNQAKDTSYQRPWTSIELAILGGTQFISENYVGRGQNNLYYQKFNVKIPPYNTNQYMTNIMAPSQETETLYYRYKNLGFYEQSFTFEIPVYKDMPDYVSLPSNASSDNSLKSISINDRLIENFDKDVREYTYYVQRDSNSVNIKAVTSDAYATVDGTGNRNLTGDETTLSLIVKAENGDTRTYKITIKKVEGVKTISEIISTLSTKTNANNMYGISPGVVPATLINSIKKADPTSYVDYKNINNSPVIKTGDKITITSSSNETITYSLIVTGDNDGNGKVDIVDLLNVQKHRLGYITLTDLYYIASDTNFDGKVDIVDLLNIQRYRLGYSGL